MYLQIVAVFVRIIIEIKQYRMYANKNLQFNNVKNYNIGGGAMKRNSKDYKLNQGISPQQSQSRITKKLTTPYSTKYQSQFGKDNDFLIKKQYAIYNGYDNGKKQQLEQQKQKSMNNVNFESNTQWVTHFFAVDPPNKHLKIKQIITQNVNNFNKAIIYCNDKFACRSIFNQMSTSLGPIIITEQHNTKQIEQKYMNFILKEYRLLITNLDPSKIFKQLCIDIEDVNLIINQSIQWNPQTYKRRVMRSTQLGKQSKGAVISFIPYTYKLNIKGTANQEKYKLETLEKTLNTKFYQYNNNRDLERTIQYKKQDNGRQRQRQIQKQKERQRQIEKQKQKEVQLQMQKKREKERERQQQIQKQNERRRQIEKQREKQRQRQIQKQKQKQKERQRQIQNEKEKERQRQEKEKSQTQKKFIEIQKQKQNQMLIENEVQRKRQIENKIDAQKKTQANKNPRCFSTNKYIKQDSETNDSMPSPNYHPLDKQNFNEDFRDDYQFNLTYGDEKILSNQKIGINQRTNATITAQLLKLNQRIQKDSNKLLSTVQQSINQHRNGIKQLTKDVNQLKNVPKETAQHIKPFIQNIPQETVQKLKPQIKNIPKETKAELLPIISNATQELKSLITNQTQMINSVSNEIKAINNNILPTNKQNERSMLKQSKQTFIQQYKSFTNNKMEQIRQNIQNLSNEVHKLNKQQKPKSDSQNEEKQVKRILKGLLDEVSKFKQLLKSKQMEIQKIKQSKQTDSQNLKSYLNNQLTQIKELLKMLPNTINLFDIQQKKGQSNEQKFKLLLQQTKQIKKILQNLLNINKSQNNSNMDLKKDQTKEKEKLKELVSQKQKQIAAQQQQLQKQKKSNGEYRKKNEQLQQQLQKQKKLKLKYMSMSQINNPQTVRIGKQETQKFKKESQIRIMSNYPQIELNKRQLLNNYKNYNNSNKSYFLGQSKIYNQLNAHQQQFLYNSIVGIVKSVSKTKSLFEGSTDLPFNGWLNKIAKKSNILMLMKLRNGHIISGFCQDYFDATPPKVTTQTDAFLMSLTNLKKYDLKRQKKGKAMVYNKYYFGLGNDEFLVYHDLTFSLMMESVYCYFDFKKQKPMNFIGQVEDKGRYESVEFHQIFTDEKSYVG